MAVSFSVEILNAEEDVTEATNRATAIDLVRTTGLPIGTLSGEAVIDVVSGALVLNAVISTVPPGSPYLGQVWIDIS